MQTFASIEAYPLRISGWPNSGWRVAESLDAAGREILFRLAITDDGDGHFLFVLHSHDQAYVADSWHESLADAYNLAEEIGIERGAWTIHPVPASMGDNPESKSRPDTPRYRHGKKSR